ncbi:MAG: DUF2232 domain-containing protein [Candidatus Hydrogenedentes bacterium]|nr:DUF2232 domain-containing protein [Candidatus Hydrogenedentota bacterium]
MLSFVSIAVGHFAAALLIALLQLDPLALFLLPPAVAVYWAEEKPRHSVALVALAAAAALVATASLAAAGIYAAFASLGILLGWTFTRRWPYGRCVAAVTAAGFTLYAALLLARWDVMRQVGRAWMSAQLREVERFANGENATAEAMTQALQWFSEHWDHLALGMLFGMVLLGMGFVVSGAAAWLRRRGEDRVPAGGFRELRPPEHLVWAVILVGALWFVDQRWTHDLLRAFTWNSAVGLTFIYWLNGFSVLVFAMTVFKVHPFVFYSVVVAVLMLRVHTILATFGLFDTWWDFRRKCAKVMEGRRLRESHDDREL